MMKKCLELSNMDSLIVGNTYLEVRMRKHNGKKIIGAILLLVILVLVGNGKMQQAKADPLQPEIARKILRFHILANSDSEEDQAVKIKVRDAIGKMMGPKLADSKNLEETKKIVSENMNDIVALAEKTLEDNGYTYGAAAELAHVQFPEKNYGDITGGVCFIRICVFRAQSTKSWMKKQTKHCVKYLHRKSMQMYLIRENWRFALNFLNISDKTVMIHKELQ